MFSSLISKTSEPKAATGGGGAEKDGGIQSASSLKRRGASDKVNVESSSGPLHLFSHFDWRRSLSDQVKGIREGALAKLWRRCQQTRLAGDVTARLSYVLVHCWSDVSR